MEVVALGAGRDVGRSCIVVTLGDKRVMFDCGMHMGYKDDRRFPDFSQLAPTGGAPSAIDAVVISHFHLDHCGALPYLTEVIGYDGPVYMTAPTAAICPLLLEDYRQLMTDRRAEPNFYSSADISRCMEKVICVGLHETVVVIDGLTLTPYYAGHVLGAAMFHAENHGLSVLYTGDFNTTPDRHLRAAQLPRLLRPTLLITESTYADTIRESKRSREREFLMQVHESVSNGGKVLIPVFALGRAQELLLLLESYWERMRLTVPIYFSAGMVQRANELYKLFASWTSEQLQAQLTTRNLFDFRHVRPFPSKATLHAPGACVLFATPGMLNGGLALEAFKVWHDEPTNVVLIPGYCVDGTIGAQLQRGAKEVLLDGRTLQVRCQVSQVVFSAHADVKGILSVVRASQPGSVMLVHGEAAKMAYLKQRIERDYGLPCYDPPNMTRIDIEARASLPLLVSTSLLPRRRHRRRASVASSSSAVVAAASIPEPGSEALFEVLGSGDWGSDDDDDDDDSDEGEEQEQEQEQEQAQEQAQEEEQEQEGGEVDDDVVRASDEDGVGQPTKRPLVDRSVRRVFARPRGYGGGDGAGVGGGETEIDGVLLYVPGGLPPDAEQLPPPPPPPPPPPQQAQPSGGRVAASARESATAVVSMGEAADMLGLREHRLTTVLSLPWPTSLAPAPTGSSALAPICARLCGAEGTSAPSAGSSSGAGLAGGATWCQVDGAVRAHSVQVQISSDISAASSGPVASPPSGGLLQCSWQIDDEALARACVDRLTRS